VKICSALSMVAVGCLVAGVVGGLKSDLPGKVFGLLSAARYASYVQLCKYCNAEMNKNIGFGYEKNSFDGRFHKNGL